MRLLVEMTARHNLQPGHRRYRTARRLERATKDFDTRLTALQRTISRFGGAKAPDELSIEIDKARSLRAISASLMGILDTMRYAVGPHALRARLVYDC